MNSSSVKNADYGLNRLRLGAIFAVAVAVAFGAWLLVHDEDNKGSKRGESPAPVPASVEKLKRLSSEVGHSVYWAGTRQGYTYELSRTTQGDVYIRYLPPGVQLNDRRPNFLTVGTYPHRNAFATVKKASRRKGEYVRRIGGGGLAVSSPSIPRSVYLAYPASDYLIEVYDRSPARARSLARSGRVRPIG